MKLIMIWRKHDSAETSSLVDVLLCKMEILALFKGNLAFNPFLGVQRHLINVVYRIPNCAMAMGLGMM